MAPTPSIWRGLAPDAEILKVLHDFGVQDASVQSLSPLVIAGTRDCSLRVRASGGDWVLKRHPPDGLQRLQDAHGWELRLQRDGFPVAPLRHAGHGGTLVRTADSLWSMHAWVPGRHLSIAERDDARARDPELPARMGAMVGMLHRVSKERDRGTPTRFPHGRGIGDGNLGDPDRLLRAPGYALRRLRRPRLRPPGLPLVQTLRLRPNKSDFDRWILQTLPEVVQHAGRLSRHTFSGEGPPDVGLIHHDLNWENIVLDEDLSLRALLDFDNAIRGPWMLEVGSAAVVLAGTDPVSLERFLSAYQAESGIEVDVHLVRVAMQLKCVQSILNSLVIYLAGDTDITLREPWCRHLFASLRDLTHEGDGSSRGTDQRRFPGKSTSPPRT